MKETPPNEFTRADGGFGGPDLVCQVSGKLVGVHERSDTHNLMVFERKSQVDGNGRQKRNSKDTQRNIVFSQFLHGGPASEAYDEQDQGCKAHQQAQHDEQQVILKE